MTVSSPWNIGINLSPRIISDWLSGRNRHNTLILHSALVSAIVGGEEKKWQHVGRIGSYLKFYFKNDKK